MEIKDLIISKLPKLREDYQYSIDTKDKSNNWVLSISTKGMKYVVHKNLKPNSDIQDINLHIEIRWEGYTQIGELKELYSKKEKK